MPVEVLETPLASAQAAGLRGPAARAYHTFLDDLARNGCAALAYRVTGPTPLDRLCVKHLRGADRVVVAFEAERRAWVLLVGAHRDDDPGRGVYDALYELAGAQSPADTRRRKPPCCDDEGVPPTLDEAAVGELVSRARELLGRDRRRAAPRSRRSGGRRRRGT